MAKVYFDKMQLTDLDDVIRIEFNTYPVPWPRGIMEDCIKEGYHCIVIKHESAGSDKIIGYAFLITAFDESHLLNMCVDGDHQGNGLGRKLLKYLENICIYNHSEIFLLEVRESNPIAQKLYQSFGFKKIGIRKNYYRCIEGRENAIVMTKKINKK
ncbi:MAG: ribosomal protein S18-alanine N-acetyltransferase [Alcanivoracaceae bacterium]|nr:ribosomal protein S18-alanine N-acetyltransferase [Alcanivoracaceae bacterium]